MKIIRIDEYNIVMHFDAEEKEALFREDSVAQTASELARAAGICRGAHITYIPSPCGAALFVSAAKADAGGNLEERYIYKFDDVQPFLAVCREIPSSSSALALTDGSSFYLSFADEEPVAGEFGGVLCSRRDGVLCERLTELNTGTEKLGELAL